MRPTLIVGTLVVLVVLAVSLFGCSVIQPGHVGIVVDKFGANRGVQDYTVRTGQVFYNPLTTSIVEYPTYVQTVKWTQNPHEGGLNDKGPGTEDESITFTTGGTGNDRGGVVVNADISLSFQLEQERIPAFYVKFRSDDVGNFAYGFLHNITRDAMMEVGGHYTVEDVMGNNEAFLHAVRDRIQGQVAPIGVTIQQFGLIGAPRPPVTIIQAINAAQQAKYLAVQKQNELLQAQAEAAKSVAYAQGDAASILAKAEGQAKANHLLSESLTDKVLERTRMDVQWHLIDKWNGQLPVTSFGGATSPNLLLQTPTTPR